MELQEINTTMIMRHVVYLSLLVTVLYYPVPTYSILRFNTRGYCLNYAWGRCNNTLVTYDHWTDNTTLLWVLDRVFPPAQYNNYIYTFLYGDDINGEVAARAMYGIYRNESNQFFEGSLIQRAFFNNIISWYVVAFWFTTEECGHASVSPPKSIMVEFVEGAKEFGRGRRSSGIFTTIPNGRPVSEDLYMYGIFNDHYTEFNCSDRGPVFEFAPNAFE